MAWAGRVNRLNRAAEREYSQPATYFDADDQPHPIKGIFSRRYLSLDPGTGATIDDEAPNLGVRLSELPELPEIGRRIEVEGEPLPFEIKSVQRDGQGMAVLLLYELDP